MNIKQVILVLLFVNFTIVSSYAQESIKKETTDQIVPISKGTFSNLRIQGNEDVAAIDFKIKFPGHPTILVKGNTLNEEALARLKEAKIGTQIIVFDITYDDSDEIQKKEPLLFKLTATF